MKSVYKTHVSIKNIETDKVIMAEVVHYEPLKRLIVDLESIEIVMFFNSKLNQYIGVAAGLEFVSSAPELIATYKESRR